jgi:alkanesulfonate monooxygenase SsuD/methylene tetrahydromethanopterin reductase-like flavin-dependent oxidoreductase (luciferase family)
VADAHSREAGQGLAGVRLFEVELLDLELGSELERRRGAGLDQTLLLKGREPAPQYTERLVYGGGERVGRLTGYHLRRSFERPVEEIRDLCALADRLGYSSVWVSEAWGRDAFLLLAQLAMVTSQARLGTGIVNVFSRSAAGLAQAVATLDELSGGRAILGIGLSGPRVIEDWHGMAWEHAGRRLREVTEIVRLAVSGARVDYEGHVIRLKGFRLQFKPVREAIPVYWGVYSDRSIKSAGRHADGWLAGEVPLDAWPRSQAALAEGAAEAGRPVPPTAMMLQVTVCSSEQQLAESRHRLRRDIAFRVGGLGPFHRAALAERGFGEECDQVAVHWAAGRRDEATAAVSDRLLASMGRIGSASEVLDFIEEVRAAGVEEPLVTLPQATPAELVAATLTACAPARAAA